MTTHGIAYAYLITGLLWVAIAVTAMDPRIARKYSCFAVVGGSMIGVVLWPVVMVVAVYRIVKERRR